MTRQAARVAMALVLVAVVLDSTGRSQPANPDRIYYRDKKDRDGTPKSVDGELKASPAGYQVISGGKVIAVISPADIVRVIPGDHPPLERKDVLAQVTLEEKKDWEKARVGYVDLLKKNTTAPEKTKRFLEYKVATLSARTADEAADDGGWKEKTEEAVKMLSELLVTLTSGWEVWPAGRTLARLQMELGKYEDAARTWGKLAKNAEVPADLRQEAGLQEVDLLIRGKQYAVASARSGELLTSAPAGAVKDRLTIYAIAAKYAAADQATGVTQIEAEIARTKDPSVRATGYAMLGELHLAADKPRDAMWAFLWVEVVYNQDRDEVVKAMVRLTDTFRAQNDDEKAKSYREKLRRYRGTL